MVSFNRRIVRILEESGLVEMDVLAEAAQLARDGTTSVTDYLLSRGVVDDRDLLGALSERLGVPPIDLERVDSFIGSLGGSIPYWAVPLLDEDVYDIQGLLRMRSFLFDGAGAA